MEPADPATPSAQLKTLPSATDYSMGSQFFIVYEDSAIPSDSVGGYTVFGRVTEGLDAIKAIAAEGVAGGATDGPPAQSVTLENVSVE